MEIENDENYAKSFTCVSIAFQMANFVVQNTWEKANS